MTRLGTWWAVGLLLLLFGGGVWWALSARAASGQGLPDYSVYSEGENGLAEAARFLQKLGYEPVALTRLAQTGRLRGLLILAGGSPHKGSSTGLDIPEGEAKTLLKWVAAGNTLMLCTNHSTEVHAALQVPVQTDATATAEDVVKVEVAGAGGYTVDMARVAVEGRHTLPSSAGLPLWWVEGRPGALVVPHGRGRVLVCADPSILTLRGLRRADNAVFLYNVVMRHAVDGKVWFDEYHHGLQSVSGFWAYLAYHGAQGVLIPALLLVFMGVWSIAVRLGPPVPTPVRERADAVDYAAAVARIYERVGVRRPLGRALVRGFLGALTRHLRLRRTALPAEILAAWRHQHPGDNGQRLQGLLRAVAELRKGEVSEKGLLFWSQTFDSFVTSFQGPNRKGMAPS